MFRKCGDTRLDFGIGKAGKSLLVAVSLSLKIFFEKKCQSSAETPT